jgi:hypothetical protein
MSAPISRDQMRAIHAVRRSLGIDEDIYRGILEDQFNVRSSKDLTSRQAAKLLDHFNGMAGKLGLPTKPARRALKYDELEGRPEHFATPKQLRMIEAMWAEVSVKTTTEDRARALSSLLFRIVESSHITMLMRQDVRKVIAALKAMKANPPNHSTGDTDGRSNGREEGGEVKHERSAEG